MVRHISFAAVLGCVAVWGTAAGAATVDRALFASEAVYELHLSNPSFRYCDVNKDGAFQPRELKCYDRVRWTPPRPEPTLASTETRSPKKTRAVVTPYPSERKRAAAETRSRSTTPLLTENGLPVVLPHPSQQTESNFVVTTPAFSEAWAPPPEPEPAEAKKQKKCLTRLGFLIRRSKPDIGSFADPTCFRDAQGAEFAWANDRVDEKEVWSARGLIARPITVEDQIKKTIPNLHSLSLSPYIAFDRTSDAETIEELIDNLTWGGVFEFGFANVLGGTQFFDIDGGLVTGFNGTGKNWGVNLAWEPKGDKQNIGTVMSVLGQPQPLGGYFTYTFSPTLQTGFASEISEAELQPLFADNDWALRSGPLVVFSINGADDAPWWIKRIGYEVTYGWLYDWISSRDYELMDTALTLGLDDTGHLGLTFSYRKGQLEETGQPVDLANIALSVSY